MLLARRELFKGFLAAPLVVRTPGLLMPVKSWRPQLAASRQVTLDCNQNNIFRLTADRALDITTINKQPHQLLHITIVANSNILPDITIDTLKVRHQGNPLRTLGKAGDLYLGNIVMDNDCMVITGYNVT